MIRNDHLLVAHLCRRIVSSKDPALLLGAQMIIRSLHDIFKQAYFLSTVNPEHFSESNRRLHLSSFSGYKQHSLWATNGPRSTLLVSDRYHQAGGWIRIPSNTVNSKSAFRCQEASLILPSRGIRSLMEQAF
jgi:hypothetical protein